MISSEEIDELFRCLLSGIAAPADDRQLRFDQSRQLLLAFERIGDCELRQELIVLIEIVSKMPDALRKNRNSLGTQPLTQLH
ncbi:MAG: hypothetical protein ACLPX9_16015 [Rhodomicrobium sp.]